MGEGFVVPPYVLSPLGRVIVGLPGTEFDLDVFRPIKARGAVTRLIIRGKAFTDSGALTQISDLISSETAVNAGFRLDSLRKPRRR